MLALLVACVAVLVAVRASRAGLLTERAGKGRSAEHGDVMVTWHFPRSAIPVIGRIRDRLGVSARSVSSSVPTHFRLWVCIHSREASWTDPNAPYYGGLQMGWWFMRTYAPRELARWGTADRWPPAIQVWVAERAYAREHYSQAWLKGQWPVTSPPCLAYA